MKNNLEKINQLQNFAEALNESTTGSCRVKSVSIRFSNNGSTYVSITSTKSQFYSAREVDAPEQHDADRVRFPL